MLCFLSSACFCLTTLLSFTQSDIIGMVIKSRFVRNNKIGIQLYGLFYQINRGKHGGHNPGNYLGLPSQTLSYQQYLE
jgi:hypothetical protein